MNELFESLIDSLTRGDIGISDFFLPASMASALRENLLRLEASGLMRNAEIGLGHSKNENRKTRSDRISWIDNESTNDSEALFLKLINTFIRYLNETCYTGINAFEFHYALYETGSFYGRHVDQFKTNPDRKFSLICYLNPDWLGTDGGELCIYQKGHTEKIAPSMQKAVLFRSAEVEHEVLVATRPRMSIVGWLKTI